jgi:hypothetical protein
MKRVRRPSSYAGLVVAIAAAGTVSAFVACSDFTPPGAAGGSSTLSVNPKTVHLNVGGDTQLTARGASGAIVWSSSDDSVATVSFGKVTAVASGTATIRAVSGTSQASARVTVTTPAALALSTTSLFFNGVASEVIPDSQTVDVTNAGQDSLSGLTVDSISYGAGATGWLDASLTQTDAPAKLVVRPKLAALAVGSYTATISISSPALAIAPQFVSVRFTLIRPAAISLSSNSLSFTVQQGASLPSQQSISVSNGGDAPLTGLGMGTLIYSSGASGWLNASVTPSAAPASLLLQPNTAGLSPGDYTATVPVTSTIAGVVPAMVTVTYHVTAAPPPPVIVVSPPTLTFTTGSNFGSLPGLQSISITSSGVGTVSGLSATVSYTGPALNWLATPTFTGNVTTAPATLNVQPITTGLAAGVYSATIHLVSTTTGVVAKDIPITYVVNDLVLDQPSIQFITTTSTAPPSQVVSVSNLGTGNIAGVTATVTLLAGRADASWSWLSASIAGTVPQAPSATSLTLTVGRADSLGDFTARVTVSAPGMVSKTVDVSYRRQATMADDVLPILQMPSCFNCHSSPTTTNVNIGFASSDQAYSSLLNTNTTGNANGHTYVAPGDSASSNLFLVLNGLALPDTTYRHMPFACSNDNASCMNSQLRTRIYIWIQQGALKQ